MSILSGKAEANKKLFEKLNHAKLGRIDTFELLSIIIMAIDGDFDSLLKNVIFIFGFSDY